MSAGYSLVQTARLVAALRWACGRLSEIVGAWASDAAGSGVQPGGGDSADAGAADAGAAAAAVDSADAGAAAAAVDSADAGAAAAAVDMTVLSRRLAAHRSVFDGLQPDSERLASWRHAAPADPLLAEALDEIAALPGALERLFVAREVLVPELLGACREICAHAAPHCDAALASAASSLRHDLGRGGRHAAAAADAVPSSAAAAAERRLSAAGGLVGRSLLRPDSWA